jgi:branched-chain amino acid transport system substrate-binding protein
MVHDMYLVEEAARGVALCLDYYSILKIIPGKEAFRPVNEGGCPLLAKP